MPKLKPSFPPAIAPEITQKLFTETTDSEDRSRCRSVQKCLERHASARGKSETEGEMYEH